MDGSVLRSVYRIHIHAMHATNVEGLVYDCEAFRGQRIGFYTAVYDEKHRLIQV